MTIDREAIRKSYPNVLSLEKVRRILGISKRKAAWMLQNGIIKCENTGKKTRQYRVKLNDLFRYLDKYEQGDQSVMTPVGKFNDKMVKHPRPPQKAHNTIIFAKPPDDFRLWLEDEWYAESDLLLTQDIARITGYEHHTVQRWIKEKRIRSVWTQNLLISSKTWLIDFYCEEAYTIIRKSDVHIDIMKRYYEINN